MSSLSGSFLQEGDELPDFWRQIETNAIQPLMDFLGGKIEKPLTLKTYMTVYTLVYDKCTNTLSINKDSSLQKKLYSIHQTIIYKYLQTEKCSLVKGCEEGKPIVQLFVRIWDKFKLLNRWMKMFLYVLDSWYIPQNKLRPLETSGYSIFSQYLFVDVKHFFTNELCVLMKKARDVNSSGDEIDLLSKYVSVLTLLDQHCNTSTEFFEEFETLYIQNAREEYVTQAKSKIFSVTSSEYLNFKKKTTENEVALLKQCIPNLSAENVIRQILEDEFLIKYNEEIFTNEQSGLRFLLDHGCTKQIAEMFSSYVHVKDIECLKLMVSIFSMYTMELGSKIIVEAQETREQLSPVSFNGLIFSLCKLLKNLMKMVTHECFQNHFLFQRSLEHSFKQLLISSSLQKKFYEILSSYCNTYLSSTEEKVVEEERQMYLEDALQLFGYLEDKDYFLNSYRNLLAKRLLFKRSYSNELEKVVIQNLRTRCGIQYTSRLEGMMYDHETAHDPFNEFVVLKGIKSRKEQFSVRSLTKTFWPSTSEIPCRLPKEILDFQSEYSDFYLKKFSGRKIEWIHRLATVDMETVFHQKKYWMSMSSFQCIVLLQFNKSPENTFVSLLDSTGIPDTELKQILDSLTLHKKCKLLEKDEENLVYRINESFTSSLKRVKLPSITFQKEKKVSSSEDLTVLEVERSYALDASLVRIMKMRKRLTHNELVEEVVRQISTFRPSMKTVKQRIESLIEREFLCRDEPNVYSYVA
jgi:cullin 1